MDENEALNESSMEDLDLDELLNDEQAEVESPNDLYQELVAMRELIVTVPAEEEEKLRKGIINAKSKQNARLRESGMPADNSVLDFNSTPSADFQGAVQVHISLTQRSGIKILRKELPSGDF